MANNERTPQHKVILENGATPGPDAPAPIR
jgi:hypothetical protein